MTPEKKPQGFAAIAPERQREIASMGGKAAHESGNAHVFNSESARAANAKAAPQKTRITKETAAEVGRRGGLKSAEVRKAKIEALKALTVVGLLITMLCGCEEAGYIAGFAAYSAVVAGASATITVEHQRKLCDALPTRPERCECRYYKLAKLATPQECWLDANGNYLHAAR